MSPLRSVVCSVTAVIAMTATVAAQDLYDTTVLRTLNFTFHDANWMTLLRANYASQTNILADVTVDGVTYPDVGVRIRGNTSYTALPPGSEKFSLNVEMDFVNPEQDLMGYDSLNLNNGFHDPTFCREVVYNNYVAQFIPNPRANHVLVTLNGQNWGVYVNVQQFDKRMLAPHFPDTSGLRIKCANNPNGPGLRYNGSLPSGYTGYEIKDDGGLADPWAPLIAVCWSVTNEPLTTWPNIDQLFAIDPSIWSVVLENFLTDDDSYINKGADFMLYRNPTDERMVLLQTDANETFTQATWTVTRNFTATNKPVLSHVLAVPELRQRYMAHYRRVKQDLNWAYFEPIFTAHRNLIDAAVQADPKKLYSYTLFQQNFTSTVTLPYSGPAGGTLIGIQPFITQRTASLNANTELNASAPTINSVVPSDANPDPADPVSITANVTANGSAISKVELFYRPNPSSVYQRVQMTGSGGVYTAPLPVAATAGQRISYYVAATASNTYLSMSFFPVRTEWDPMWIEYTFGSAGGMRITEWMYSGTSGEFIEFTNLSDEAVDMTGWSFDDDHAVPGAFDLSGFGVVQPGESVILTEAVAETFRTAWGLPAATKIIGGLGVTSGNNLARNDVIHIYDATDALIDRLTYGDQTFPGTIRTQNFSGQTCLEHVGQDEIAGWVRSAVGDAYGSYAATTGEIGTPGTYAAFSCFPCTAPEVGTHPASQVSCPAAPVTFAVVSTGTGPLDYQWQVETAPPGSGVFTDLADGPLAGVGTVAGSTTASITVSDLAAGASAMLRCVVTNACGEDASDAASLTVCDHVGDLNCSGSVELADLSVLLSSFGTESGASREQGDLDADGAVSLGDLAMLLSNFGAVCP